MGRRDLIVLFLFVFSCSVLVDQVWCGLRGKLYVAPPSFGPNGNGSLAMPFTNLTDAYDALDNLILATSNVTLYIYPGSCNIYFSLFLLFNLCLILDD